ncbi:TetR/AcrR family transcriptional regulator [Psychromicrobium sp. YIM B11713]|uniref:TetR/AcrR family transcriptional regulator n=1 Tax=Psychromicrobium sp. YIM B11713 TaxID=3145233 RepID=UPI00374E5647
MSTAKNPIDRRSRPAKRPLSRQWIVETTIQIVKREGLAKATMRRVAAELDTGQSSLYVYLANTAELHAAVLDELLAPITAPTPASDGTTRLEWVLEQYQGILMEHPGLARSALVMRPTGSNSLRLFDLVLGVLLDGGMEPGRAAWATDWLLLLTTASAAEHSTAESVDADAPVDPIAHQNELAAATRQVDPSTAPNVAAHASLILAGSGRERFRWAIQALALGATSNPLPADLENTSPAETDVKASASDLTDH